MLVWEKAVYKLHRVCWQRNGKPQSTWECKRDYCGRRSRWVKTELFFRHIRRQEFTVRALLAL